MLCCVAQCCVLTCRGCLHQHRVPVTCFGAQSCRISCYHSWVTRPNPWLPSVYWSPCLNRTPVLHFSLFFSAMLITHVCVPLLILVFLLWFGVLGVARFSPEMHGALSPGFLVLCLHWGKQTMQNPGQPFEPPPMAFRMTPPYAPPAPGLQPPCARTDVCRRGRPSITPVPEYYAYYFRWNALCCV